MTVSETSVRAPDNTPARWLSIIGIGEDGVQGLSPVARQLIEGAELVVGGARHLELAGSLVQGERLTWPTPIDAAYPQILKRRGRQVAVLATGDPFHFGIGKQLAEIVPTDEFVCIPHVSAFALAAARMGWALQDVATITLHGRAIESVVRHLQPGARILALSWDGSTPQKLAEPSRYARSWCVADLRCSSTWAGHTSAFAACRRIAALARRSRRSTPSPWRSSQGLKAAQLPSLPGSTTASISMMGS